jgi:hypothetical protein
MAHRLIKCVSCVHYRGTLCTIVARNSKMGVADTIQWRHYDVPRSTPYSGLLLHLADTIQLLTFLPPLVKTGGQ